MVLFLGQELQARCTLYLPNRQLRITLTILEEEILFLWQRDEASNVLAEEGKGDGLRVVSGRQQLLLLPLQLLRR